jgi:hypothetical protein
MAKLHLHLSQIILSANLNFNGIRKLRHSQLKTTNAHHYQHSSTHTNCTPVSKIHTNCTERELTLGQILGPAAAVSCGEEVGRRCSGLVVHGGEASGCRSGLGSQQCRGWAVSSVVGLPSVEGGPPELWQLVWVESVGFVWG